MLVSSPCPCCGDTAFQHIGQTISYKYEGSGPDFKVIQTWCKSCGLKLRRIQDATLEDQFGALFHDSNYDDTLARVRQLYRFIGGFPVPRFSPHCWACGNRRWQAQSWSFQYQKSAGFPYRCDFAMKCTFCGLALPFGIAIPEDEWRKHCSPESSPTYYRWRQAHAIMAEQLIQESGDASRSGEQDGIRGDQD